MQIMPAEAREHRHGAPGLPAPHTANSCFDPKLNNRHRRRRVTRKKLAAEHGNTMLAIAAYNAGEETRWQMDCSTAGR